MKTVLEVIQATTAFFEKNGVESARLNIEHLLAHVLKKKRRVDLYLEFDRGLSEAELEPLRVLVKRRARGEPLQHLLGTVEFFGREFRCDGRALVPRPETEHLVELILQNLLPVTRAPKPRWAELAAAAAAREEAAADGAASESEATTPLAAAGVVSEKIETTTAAISPLPADARVLDVGTGSGIIALTLAAERPALRVAAVDASRAALALARENAEALGLAQRVEFSRGDLFQGAPTGPFDLVVANLPYVPAGEIANLAPEVRDFDPREALDGGADGLTLVARLIAEAPAHAPPATAAGSALHLALEIGHAQAAEVVNLLIEAGYEDVRTERDFQGVARFVFAKIRGG
ncbi:MAG: peptide chain release factor N(5)-glutamine methyltransferase [Verrucomicrobia bacterium]|nr:peptide chain release factor N(5)-glutamine methyltransferase [Verrucomicrobiota bacterium]